MLCRFDHVRRYPTVLRTLPGLRLHELVELLDDLLPRFATAQQRRFDRTTRVRARGGGRHSDLAPRDQILVSRIWFRQYPTNKVRGLLVGVRASPASRVRARGVPVRDAAGQHTMRRPAPGRKRRKARAAWLAATPDLAVIRATCAQRVQRSKDHAPADTYDRGQNKQHPVKSHRAVAAQTGTICAVPARVPGPMADRHPAPPLPPACPRARWRWEQGGPRLRRTCCPASHRGGGDATPHATWQGAPSTRQCLHHRRCHAQRCGRTHAQAGAPLAGCEPTRWPAPPAPRPTRPCGGGGGQSSDTNSSAVRGHMGGTAVRPRSLF